LQLVGFMVFNATLPGTPISSTNKTDRHDITEILLKVALNTIKPTNCNEKDSDGCDQ
jgi:hypothetical protein